MTIAEAEPTGASPDELPEGEARDAARGRRRRAGDPGGPGLRVVRRRAGRRPGLVPGVRHRRQRDAPAAGIRGVGVAAVARRSLLTGGAVAASYAALTDEPPPRETKVTTVATAAPAPVETTTTHDAAGRGRRRRSPPADDVAARGARQPVQPVTPVTPTARRTPTTTTPTTETEKTPSPRRPSSRRSRSTSATARSTTPTSARPPSAIRSARSTANVGTSWFATTPAGRRHERRLRARPRQVAAGQAPRARHEDAGLHDPRARRRAAASRPRSPTTRPGSCSARPARSTRKPAPARPRPPWRPPRTTRPATRGCASTSAADDEIFRQVLLWVSAPPTAGPTVRFSKIRLLQ